MAIDLNLQGKRVLVTGGSRGIGQGVAEAFAREGAALHLVARDADRLAAAAAGLAARHGVAVTTTAADLATPGGPERAVEEVGDVDVLVNSTGVVPPGTLEEVDAEAWRVAFASKVSGQVDVIRLVYPRMRARGGGVVVSIIGDGGEITDPAFVCGGAANAALAHVTRSLGGASLADGIRVLGVSPGPVETEQIVSFLRERARAEHGDPARWRDYLAGYPLGRAARVEEVADLVLFLASPRASYVSGTVVTIDGGIAARRSVV